MKRLTTTYNLHYLKIWEIKEKNNNCRYLLFQGKGITTECLNCIGTV